MDDSLDKTSIRAAAILDVRNVVCRQSQEYTNTALEYAMMLKEIMRGKECVAVFAVDGVTYDENGNDKCRIFHEELEKAGFTVILVPASNNKGKQEGVDVKIALLAQRLVLKGQCGLIELISGDGDFGELVKDLKEEGAEVNITSFRDNLSYTLKAMADHVRIIDTMPLIRMRNEFATGVI